MRFYLDMKWFIMFAALLLMVSCARTDIQSTGPALSRPDVVRSGSGNDRGKTSATVKDSSATTGVSEQTLEFDNSRTEGTDNANSQGFNIGDATQEELEAIQTFVNQDIYFDYDSFKIDAKSQKFLEFKAEWLLKNTFASVIIEGHCDDRGTTEYNLSLGERRAESVKSFLADLGVSDSRITLVSYGEERPVVEGIRAEDRAKNRRAHCEIK